MNKYNKPEQKLISFHLSEIDRLRSQLANPPSIIKRAGAGPGAMKDVGKNEAWHEVITGIERDCKIGKNPKIGHFVNLYECDIGDDCMIGSFVEIQKGAKIGNNCRIQSHSFICSGVTIEDNCFIGHGVMFINDKYPPSHGKGWKPTLVKEGAVIGSNATLLPVTIGKDAMVGAGAVVTKDVADNAVVIGNPAKTILSARLAHLGVF